ncbi:MAG TPA: hypothetical protein PKM41_15775 [Deltaproteobacteria bacterium]|jgi:hypothetical protein|nr:hypothetical protein [Deltaproteobacteria bacterium]HOI08044.1 hypothetical protein [Deltaproteobacteria bacterium]
MEGNAGWFELHIDQGLGMGYIRHLGKASLKNLNDSVQQMWSDPGFGSVMRGMSDFSEASGALSCNDIRSHAMLLPRYLPADRRLRWAVVVRTSLAYGLARMFDILTENADLKLELRIFRDVREAEAWLGLRQGRHTTAQTALRP